MEIDITAMVKDCDSMPLLSGSVAELGDDAGEMTWNNSKKYAEKHPLLKTSEEFNEAREYFKSMGAWSKKEIDDWTNSTVQAMIVQDIASAIREMEHFDDDESYLNAAREGRVSGRLFRTDNGKWFTYIH